MVLLQCDKLDTWVGKIIWLLVYKTLLPHGLIRINIKTKLTTNNYNYLL